MVYPRFNKEDDVKRALAYHLRIDLEGVDPEVWAHLVKRRWPEELIGGTGSLKEMAAEYEDLLRLRGPAAPRRAPRKLTIPPDERLLAVSEALAAHAAEDPDVKTFREKVLGGRLLKPEEVAEWVERYAWEEGRPTEYVVVPSEDGLDPPVVSEAPWWLSPAVGKLTYYAAREVGILYYQDFPPAITDAQAVAMGYAGPRLGVHRERAAWGHHGGVLYHLSFLSKYLARRYSWLESEASNFVLTSRAPLIPKARIDWSVNYYDFDPELPPRIILDLDPTISSREVALIFRQAREDLYLARHPVTGQGKSPRAARPISPKVRALAGLAGRPGTWRERLTAWNQEHPDWHYTKDDPRHFVRDANNAFRRVFGERKAGRQQ